MSEPTTELHADFLIAFIDASDDPGRQEDIINDWLTQDRAAAASRATEGLRTLIGELANNYHQTGLIRDHHDRTVAGWQVRGIETCSDLLCVEARAALSALPALSATPVPASETPEPVLEQIEHDAVRIHAAWHASHPGEKCHYPAFDLPSRPSSATPEPAALPEWWPPEYGCICGSMAHRTHEHMRVGGKAPATVRRWNERLWVYLLHCRRLAEAALHAGVPAAQQWPSVEEMANAIGEVIGSKGHHSSSHGSLCETCISEAVDILSALRSVSTETPGE